MLGVDDLKQTRFYQEIEQETKLEVLSRMLDLGLDLETMPTARSVTYAQATDLPIEVVREEANKKQRSR